MWRSSRNGGFDMIALAQLPALMDRVLPEELEALPTFYKAVQYRAPGRRMLTDDEARQVAQEVCAIRSARARQNAGRVF